MAEGIFGTIGNLLKDLATNTFKELPSELIATRLMAWWMGRRVEGSGAQRQMGVHLRAETVMDLQKIGESYGGFPNIDRRLRECLLGGQRFTEDKLVELLGTIPREDAGREFLYPILEMMNDQEFYDTMEHIRNNRIPQAAQAFVKAAWAYTSTQASRFNTWLEQQAQVVRTQAAAPVPMHQWNVRGRTIEFEKRPVLEFFCLVLGLGILILGVMLLIALYAGRGEPAGPKPNNTSCWKQVNALKGKAAYAVDDAQRASIGQELAKKMVECRK